MAFLFWDVHEFNATFLFTGISYILSAAVKYHYTTVLRNGKSGGRVIRPSANAMERAIY